MKSSGKPKFEDWARCFFPTEVVVWGGQVRQRIRTAAGYYPSPYNRYFQSEWWWGNLSETKQPSIGQQQCGVSHRQDRVAHCAAWPHSPRPGVTEILVFRRGAAMSTWTIDSRPADLIRNKNNPSAGGIQPRCGGQESLGRYHPAEVSGSRKNIWIF